MVVAYTLGRILIPLMFIVAGIQKALSIADFANTLAAANIPIPEQIVPYLGGVPKYQALGYLIVAIEVICGLMILIGLKARWAALVLLVFTACIVVFVHHFWDMTGDAMTANMAEALKYVSIMGGLLLVVAIGSTPGPLERQG